MRKKMLLTVLLSFILFSCDSKSSQKNDLENYSDHDDSDIIFSDLDFSDTDYNETDIDYTDNDTHDESDMNDINDTENEGIDADIDGDTGDYFAAPANLIAEDGVSHNRILITWDELPKNPKVYIYRSENESGPFENTGYWTDGNYFSDENIVPGKIYYYKAKADYSLKKSEFSNMDSGFSLKDDSTYEFVLASGEEGSSWGEFNNPTGIKYIDNKIVVADTGNNRIQLFNPDTLNCSDQIDKEFSPVYIGAGQYSSSYESFILLSSGFKGEEMAFDAVYGYQNVGFFEGSEDLKMPYGIAGSSLLWYINNKEMYPLHVVDTENSKIYVFDMLTNYDEGCYTDYCLKHLKTFGSEGNAEGKLQNPKGAAMMNNFDYWASTSVFVVDTGNNRISSYYIYFGNLMMSFGSEGSNDGEFNNPTDIAISENGYIFITDSGNNRVQKFSLNGNFITKFGESGSGDGQFNNPTGITVDDEGNVYVVDTGNNRIQKFKPTP